MAIGCSATINPAANTAAQTTIDRQILKMRERIRELEHERNTHALVSVLPNEIVGKIFMLSASSYGYSARLKERYNFTLVSQHWRQVALSSPIIWAFVESYDNPQWSRVILERSKMANLSVEIDISRSHAPSSPRFQFSLELIQQHWARIQALKLVVANSDSLQALLNTLPNSTSQLHALKIDLNTGSLTDPTPPVLSLERLANTKISHLQLRRCRLDWNLSSPLTKLQTLEITGGAFLPLSQVLNTLTAMPHLRTLKLQSALQIQPEEIHVSSTVIAALPNLRLLMANATSLRSVACFLRGLVVSPKASIHLDCPLESDIPYTDITAFIATLRDFLSPSASDSGPNVASYHTLHIFQRSFLMERFEVRAWRSQALIKDSVVGTPHFNLNLLADEPSASLVQWLIQVIPTGGLEELALMTVLRVPDQDLASVFGECCYLGTLVVNARTAPAFLRAIVSQDSELQLRFPRLQNIFLEGVVFLKEYVDRDGNSGQVEGITVEGLVECLTRRCEFGKPLQKVRIVMSFDLFQDGIALLEQMAVIVEWDGREQTYQQYWDNLNTPRQIPYDLDLFDNDSD